MKYGARKNLLEELKSLPYFNKEYIFQLGKNQKNYNLTNSTIDTYSSRFLRYKEIIPLKRGMYVATDFYNKNKDDVSYLFFLANILRPPSYVSSWTALQYYDLTTEAIHTITSITPKVTRSYKTKVGNFTYQSIKKELFSDFSSAKGEFDFFIASPSKALFDLLYFKTRQFRGVRLEDIKAMVEELRIDFDEMSQAEQKKFFSMIKKYINYD
jgi:predicted transcriptional regulator of viral defense system